KIMWASYRHAGIDVATSDNKHGTIATDLDLRVRGPVDGRVLEFLLANSQDPDTPGWDSHRNRLDVPRVIDGEGHDLPFPHPYHRLLVQVPPLQIGEADVRIPCQTDGETFLAWQARHARN